MKLSLRCLSSLLTGAAFVLFASLLPNCSPPDGSLPSSGGNGGDTTSGGGDGGSSGNGGSSGSGGNSASNSGGSTTSSGGKETGGAVGSGGSTTSNGGSSGTGTGGKSGGTGGKSGGTGGKTGSGGSSSNGGSSTTSNGGSGAGGVQSSGGATTTPAAGGTTGSGTAVTFSAGKAVGAMTGYGWVSLGSADTLTDPKCGTEVITSVTACASTTWSTTESLCISGSIPALPANPAQTDYDTNWGISVGVNATEPAGSGIGQTFSTVAITVTGLPASATVRAQIHKKGDVDGTSYCIALSSGSPLTLTKFATDCYNTSPTKTFAATDIPSIDKVSVQVVSGSAAVAVSNLCITKIEFAK